MDLHSGFSTRIYDYEKKELIKLIDSNKGVSLCASIVELWLTESPNHEKFVQFDSGFMCFIKDYSKKSYFFRLFSYKPNQNLNERQIKEIWSQEMYIPFNYNKLTKNFHYFAADKCNAGFNFCYEDEADMFADVFIKKYLSKIKRVEVAKCDRITENNIVKNENQSENTYYKIPILRIPPVYKEKLNNLVDSTRVYSSMLYYGKLRKKEASKCVISLPTNFKVIQHVGIDSNNELECNLKENETSQKIKQILKELNMKNNRKTRLFVENFIFTHQNETDQMQEKIEEKPKENSIEMVKAENQIIKDDLVKIKPEEPSLSVIKKTNENNLFQENKIQPKEEKIINNDGSMYDQLRRQLDAMRTHLDESSDEENDSDWDL